jgi:hypothetical protein
MKDNLKKNKDGSYILKSKSKEGKGTCKLCGENSKTRDLLFRYTTEDYLLVKQHIENHLLMHPTHESVTPKWCDECHSLLEYIVRIKNVSTNS